MATKINFEQARQDHMAWMYKMRNFLNGVEELKKEEIISHLHCRLGKWFYAEGKDEFGNLEPIKKFELKHIKLHQLAKDIFEFKKIGNIAIAEDLYEDLERTSKQIVALLNEAEYIIILRPFFKWKIMGFIVLLLKLPNSLVFLQQVYSQYTHQ